MDLASLKQWQWALIGIVAGAIIGLSWMRMPASTGRNADPNEFKMIVGNVSSGARYPVNKDLPLVKNIQILPPETDPDGKLVYSVRFDRLGVNAKDQTVYQEQWLNAKTPFEGNQSIIDFLAQRGVSFSDRTGVGQYRPVAMGAAVGLFSVGFLWPAFISFLVGAGLEKPKPKEVERIYASGPQNDGTIKEKKKGVSAKDVSDLNALNDRLEASVGKGLKARGGKNQDSEVEEIVSKLMSGSGARNTEDPTAASVPAAPQEEKEYAGEWYPVARPKHHDEKK